MLSDEEREIFNNLKDYMQSKIDNGYHKFIYNDLDWDFKCIDCINAIDKVLKQSKEIERTNEILIWKQKHEEQLQKEIEELKETNEEIGKALDEWNNGERTSIFHIHKAKINAKIEEIKDKEKKCILFISESNCKNICMENCSYAETIEVLQSLLEKE